MQSIDREIRDTELRLAWRRHQLDRTVHALGSTTARKLASPAALAAVAVAGFVVGGLAGRRPRKLVHDRRAGSAAKKSGIVGLLMTGAIALLRARYANPAAIMDLYSRFARKDPARRTSTPGASR